MPDLGCSVRRNDCNFGLGFHVLVVLELRDEVQTTLIDPKYCVTVVTL